MPLIAKRGLRTSQGDFVAGDVVPDNLFLPKTLKTLIDYGKVVFVTPAPAPAPAPAPESLPDESATTTPSPSSPTGSSSAAAASDGGGTGEKEVDLSKYTRAQLNAYATEMGIEDADDPKLYPNISSLVKAIEALDDDEEEGK